MKTKKLPPPGTSVWVDSPTYKTLQSIKETTGAPIRFIIAKAVAQYNETVNSKRQNHENQ